MVANKNGKRLKVTCPICGGTHITRASKFRHCGIEHDTTSNLFFTNTTTTTNDDTKLDKDKTEIKPDVKQLQAKNETKPETITDKNDTKPETITDSKDDKGVTITYRDKETGEVLLQSDNCAYFGGTWEAGEANEVVMEVDRGKTKEKTNLPKEVPEATITQNNPTDKPIWENKIVQGLGIAAFGVGLSYFLKTRKGKTNPDTDW